MSTMEQPQKIPIYLDYNATTPVDKEVAEVMKPYIDTFFGNPSSSHYFGIQTKKAIENARKHVCALLNCSEDELIFTSGGSESNNYAIKGVAFARNKADKNANHIITTVIEHPAVLEVVKYLVNEHQFTATYLPVDEYGMVSVEDVEKAIIPGRTVLITVMHANNEVGTIQPIEEISKVAKKYNVLVHTDASQSVGKIPTNVHELGVDLLTVCSHKFYGPKGIGALYIRRGVQLTKLMHGATHEHNLRAGTENVMQIVGLGKACELAKRDLTKNMEHMQHLRDRLHQGLIKELGESSFKLNGHPVRRLPNTLNVSFPNIEANTLLNSMEDDVAASAGAACHSDDVKVSYVLEAMGVPVSTAMGTCRFSTGKYLTEAQVDEAIEVISKAVKKLRPQQQSQEEEELEVCDLKTLRLTATTGGLGCGCKLRPQALERLLKDFPFATHRDENVMVGVETSDDAAVYKVDDNNAVVTSVDFFTPVVDDPFDFGAIACANSLSDIYAMGAKPAFALNIVAFPSNRLPLEVLRKILLGAQAKADEAGVSVLGGHTIDDPEPKYGMSVTGFVHPQRIWRNSTARPGDALILTKPLGLGVITTAMKRRLVDEATTRRAIKVMSDLNKYATDVLHRYEEYVHACTDVTGFGLIGHLHEVTHGSQVNAEIYADEVPILPEALPLIVGGIVPGGTTNNHSWMNEVGHVKYHPEVSPPLQLLLCDAQTSGGILAAVSAEVAEQIVQEMRGSGNVNNGNNGFVPIQEATIIGYMTEANKDGIITVLPSRSARSKN